MDEGMSPEIISKVLWRHDPANTGCNVCEGMEDEYDRIAINLISHSKHLQSFENFRAVLVDAFFEEALSPDDLQRSYEEILSL